VSSPAVALDREKEHIISGQCLSSSSSRSSLVVQFCLLTAHLSVYLLLSVSMRLHAVLSEDLVVIFNKFVRG